MEEKITDIEEDKVQEAEIETPNQPDALAEKTETSSLTPNEEMIEIERDKKMDAYIEFALIFILGILIGIAIKTQASNKITIGFDDYQMKSAKQDFNINQLQSEMTQKSIENSGAAQDESGQENPAGN